MDDAQMASLIDRIRQIAATKEIVVFGPSVLYSKNDDQNYPFDNTIVLFTSREDAPDRELVIIKKRTGSGPALSFASVDKLIATEQNRTEALQVNTEKSTHVNPLLQKINIELAAAMKPILPAGLAEGKMEQVTDHQIEQLRKAAHTVVAANLPRLAEKVIIDFEFAKSDIIIEVKTNDQNTQQELMRALGSDNIRFSVLEHNEPLMAAAPVSGAHQK